jgi:molybdopterin/thiamine biosynthesis adenylyltransferase
VAGLGGLGATVSQLMVRGGIGTLHLVDDGTVALSDLQRQTLYGECDLGRLKVEVAAERLRLINSQVRIVSHPRRIDAGFTMPEGIDGAADCLDNFASRFQLFRALPEGKLFLHGGVQGDQGQVLTLVKGRSRPLEEIFAGSRQPEGTIPVTPDSALIVAGLLARELFLALGGSPRLLDRFLVVDLAGLSLSFLEV